MAERAALDSNVLIYAVAGSGPKRARAGALLQGGGVVSVQALNEVCHVLRRKMAFTVAEAGEALAVLRALLDVVPLTLAVHDRALRVAASTGYTIWDAAILGAAAEAGCGTLWSEDMQHGRAVEGVTVRNPFP